jgi:hypothetical protein
MKINRLVFLFALIGGPLSLMLPNSIQADIISASGQLAVVSTASVPSSIIEGAWEDTNSVRIFRERDRFLLPSPVTVDIVNPGTYGRSAGFVPVSQNIPANTRVQSYLMHFDPVGTPANLTRSGSVTFDLEVLGIIAGVRNGVNVSAPDNTLGLSSPIVGLPGVTYDTAITDLFAGGGDQIVLSADRKTLSFIWISGAGSDNLRIITAAVPEPSSMTLVAGAFFGGLFRRSRRTS